MHSGRGISHTEASGKDVILLRPFACRELVVQTELAIAVITAQGSVFRRALGQEVVIFDLSSGFEGVKGALVQVQGIVEGGCGGSGLGGVERDDRAIGETGAFAKRGGRCIQRLVLVTYATE